ncbi:MAG: molybdopterin-dependent oxidoreductase [Vicinamibacterales bacterium]
MDRRTFLQWSAAAGLAPVGAIVDEGRVDAFLRTWLEQPACDTDPLAGGTRVGTRPLTGAGGFDQPLDVIQGAGLDGRLVTDLSTLTPDTLVTPNARFFVRTRFPEGGPPPSPWTIRVGGLVERNVELRPEELARDARSFGPLHMECAGNANPASFGLMSAARWGGVPLLDVVARARPSTTGTRVMVEGFDTHAQAPTRSSAGASWIFDWNDVRQTGAFLAFSMNGEPLPRDHGAPARLIVPGWYGAANIKWVTDVRIVDDDAPATTQMREYAARTHQRGVPTLARDYEPAVVDAAAFPVRVEHWRVGERALYRVVGIVWGGSTPVRHLSIRFNRQEPFRPVTLCPPPGSTESWSLWTHVWTPTSLGRHQIVLRVDDADTRTRRLDIFFYVRDVWIEAL